jgi:hypothetical protein
MKRLITTAIVAAIALSSTPAFAATKVSYGRCPAFIGNQKTKTFISGSNLVCSGTTMKKGGMKQSETLVTGKHDFQTDFDWTGQGESNSPAFQVGKIPATVTYTYNDFANRGGFKIQVVDITTHKVVETLVNSHGAVSSTTLLQRQGGFYLHIEGATDVKSEDDSPADWEVQVSFDDSSGGGDDFDFGF